MGREILGLAGDSLFIEQLNLAYKTADAVLQKKASPCSEENTSNGRAIGSIVDDLFLKLTIEKSELDNAFFPSVNTELTREFSSE